MSNVDFTVLFDLDGTLLNTLGDLADAINYTMRKLGYPEKTDAEVLAAIGSGLRRAIEIVLPEEADASEVDPALGILREQYAKCYMNRTHPYPGIMELLRELRADGYKIAVISNKTDAFTVGLINKHFKGLVDAAMGEQPGIPLKPDPEAVRTIISQVGGVPEKTVYIGDSDVDIATARNAGIPCVLVSWGFRSRELLLGAGADPASIADSAEEVLTKIRAIAARRKMDSNVGVRCENENISEREGKTLYISDLDGTLFDGDARISEYTAREINRLIRQGMHFTVATARSPASTFQLIEPINVNAPIIMMNGVLIYDPISRRYINVERIDAAAASGIAETMRRFGMNGFMYALCDNALMTYYTNLESKPLRMFYEERTRLFNKKFVKTESFDKVIRSGKQVVYFMLRGVESELKPVCDEFVKIPGIKAILCEDNYIPELYFLECFGSGASKGKAVRYLRELGGYDLVVGFGDNMNDLPFFLECDECYAPENAQKDVKSAATAVIGANVSDGVARWLCGRFNE